MCSIRLDLGLAFIVDLIMILEHGAVYILMGQEAVWQLAQLDE